VAECIREPGILSTHFTRWVHYKDNASLLWKRAVSKGFGPRQRSNGPSHWVGPEVFKSAVTTLTQGRVDEASRGERVDPFRPSNWPWCRHQGPTCRIIPANRQKAEYARWKSASILTVQDHRKHIRRICPHPLWTEPSETVRIKPVGPAAARSLGVDLPGLVASYGL